MRVLQRGPRPRLGQSVGGSAGFAIPPRWDATSGRVRLGALTLLTRGGNDAPRSVWTWDMGYTVRGHRLHSGRPYLGPASPKCPDLFEQACRGSAPQDQEPVFVPHYSRDFAAAVSRRCCDDGDRKAEKNGKTRTPVALLFGC
jgi:hypothetical protein